MSNEGLNENEQLDVPAVSLPVIDEAPVETVVETPVAVSYTHLTLPTTPYV